MCVHIEVKQTSGGNLFGGDVMSRDGRLVL